MTNFLSSDWSNFIANLSIFGGISAIFLAVFYIVIRLAIKHAHSKKLAKLQSDLTADIENLKSNHQQQLETLKLDHQRLMFDFQSYNTKIRYPELYKLIADAYAHIMSLRGYRRSIDLEKHSEDIKLYCEAIDMLPGETEKIVALWAVNRQHVIIVPVAV